MGGRGVEIVEPEGWKEPKKILVILAHPDDPEFFCGATLARWTHLGHIVRYCLFTRGDKGIQGDQVVNPAELMATREKEQNAAAGVLGVQNVRFLNYADGYLQAGLEERKAVVRVIRQEKPDIIVTSDPLNYFIRESRLNHPDHRTAGQIVMDAVFPAAGNPMFFPELLVEGLHPHAVAEIWFSLTGQGNTSIDVTETWPLRIKALQEHKSQIPDVDAFLKNQKNRRTTDSTEDNPRYVDNFRRIIFA
jgi:LmbE family N-acetylglucosaminyl deacetylase